MELVLPIKRTSGFPVEVRPAGSKGLGVFATRRIRRGELCCWYDGMLCPNRMFATAVTGDFGYAQSTVNDQVIAGFRTMLRPGGCAQLCNDASTEYIDMTDLKYLKHINVTKALYSEASGGKAMIFFATKPIAKGDELLYSYGAEYWATKKLREADAPGSTWRSLFARSQVEKMARMSPSEAAQRTMVLAQYTTEGETLEAYKKRFTIARLLDIGCDATLVSKGTVLGLEGAVQAVAKDYRKRVAEQAELGAAAIVEQRTDEQEEMDYARESELSFF